MTEQRFDDNLRFGNTSIQVQFNKGVYVFKTNDLG